MSEFHVGKIKASRSAFERQGRIQCQLLISKISCLVMSYGELVGGLIPISFGQETEILSRDCLGPLGKPAVSTQMSTGPLNG